MCMTPSELGNLPPNQYQSLLEWWRMRYPARGREIEVLLAQIASLILAFGGDKKTTTPFDIAPWLKPLGHDKRMAKEAEQKQTDFVLQSVRAMDM